MQPNEQDAFDRAEHQHEARSRAAAEMATVLGMAPETAPPEATEGEGKVGPADAGERSKPQRLKRTPGQNMYRALFGYDYDDVPGGIDDPPAA
jgi:hypothetical protein